MHGCQFVRQGKDVSISVLFQFFQKLYMRIHLTLCGWMARVFISNRCVHSPTRKNFGPRLGLLSGITKVALIQLMAQVGTLFTYYISSGRKQTTPLDWLVRAHIEGSLFRKPLPI